VSECYVIERFSFECRKVIGFAFTTLRDWLKKLAPLFHPIRSKTKTNRDALVRVFPRFASATCNYFVFWLVHLIICVVCYWLEWLLWFWFYDTQLKTALINEKQALVLQRLASAIQRINLYPVDRAISFPSTYPLYGDLSFSWIALSNTWTTRARTPYCACPIRKETSITLK